MRNLLFFLITLINLTIFGQESAGVIVDFSTKLYLDNINTLDRERFFGIQESFMSSFLKNEAPYLINGLNVHFAVEKNGPEPAANLNNLSSKKIIDFALDKKAGYSKTKSDYNTHNYLLTQKEKNVYRGEQNNDIALEKVDKYLSNAYSIVPDYYNLMELEVNESIVENEKIKKYAFYKNLVSRLKLRHPMIKFGGAINSSPEFYKNNFLNWDRIYYPLFESLNKDTDYLSFKIFDKVNPTTKLIDYISGAKLNATLDLLETYTFNKKGYVNPYLISEYGLYNNDWIEDNYKESRDIFLIESLNKILVSLMKRENKILKAIPKINSIGNQYSLTQKTNHGEIRYTHLIKFYEFWKDFNGERMLVDCDNPDINIVGLKNGQNYQFAFNNLSGKSTTLDIDYMGIDYNDFESFSLKRIYMNSKGLPELTKANSDYLIDQIEIEPHETIIISCTTSDTVDFVTNNYSHEYYATEYLKPIISGSNNKFYINNVLVDSGKAFLRVSFGIDRKSDLSPIIKINNHTVLTPNNWAGDDQAYEKMFYGTLNIPIPISYVKKENIIDIKFANGGGKISSVILNTLTYKDPLYENHEVIFAINNGKELNISDDIDATSSRIVNSKGKVIQKIKYIKKGVNIDISNLYAGEYYLETNSGRKIKFIK